MKGSSLDKFSCKKTVTRRAFSRAHNSPTDLDLWPWLSKI